MSRKKALGLSFDERICDPKDFTKLKGEGKAVFGKHIVFVRRQNSSNHMRMGVIVTRKTGSAVTRNRWKRVIRVFFRTNKAMLQEGVDHLWVVKSSVRGTPSLHVSRELKELVVKSRQRFAL